MKNKGLLILMVCAMAGCTVAAANSAEQAVVTQDLICGEDCDPGNFQWLISEMVGATQGLDSLGPAYCHQNTEWGEFGTRTWNECSGTYRDPWGQRYFVDCVDSQPTPCDVMACGNYPQPSC